MQHHNFLDIFTDFELFPSKSKDVTLEELFSVEKTPLPSTLLDKSKPVQTTSGSEAFPTPLLTPVGDIFSPLFETSSSFGTPLQESSPYFDELTPMSQSLDSFDDKEGVEGGSLFPSLDSLDGLQPSDTVTLTVSQLSTLLAASAKAGASEYAASVSNANGSSRLSNKRATLYNCPKAGCGKSFSRRYNLQAHILTHDAFRQRPFACPFVGCGKSFMRSNDLNRHKARHERQPMK